MPLLLSLPLLLLGTMPTPSAATPARAQEDAAPAAVAPASTQDAAAPFGEVALPDAARLSPAQLAAWHDYLMPTAEETAFESLPWRSTFADGLRDADAVGKPLLLWVMNGHPLGCT